METSDANEDSSNDFSIIKPVNKDFSNSHTDATELKNNSLNITNAHLIKKGRI